MVTNIPFDDDLIDTIQEFRTSKRPLAENAGLADRILAAIYHGIDGATDDHHDDHFAAYDYHDDPVQRRGFASRDSAAKQWRVDL